MRYERFCKLVDFRGWLSMNGLHTWHVATYKDHFVLLLYRQNYSYGIAIEAYDRLQGHGYDIITQIDGLPNTQYDIVNNTISRLLNEDDFQEIGIRVAEAFDVNFNR